MKAHSGSMNTRHFTRLCDQIEERKGVPWPLLWGSLTRCASELFGSWRARGALVVLASVSVFAYLAGVAVVSVVVVSGAVTAAVVVVVAVVVFNIVERTGGR